MDSHKMEKTLKQDRDAINDVQKEVRGLSDRIEHVQDESEVGQQQRQKPVSSELLTFWINLTV